MATSSLTKDNQKTPTIAFDATIERVNSKLIIRVPEGDDALLSSRGQVSVVATLDGVESNIILEPDGYGGHWISVSDFLNGAERSATFAENDAVRVTLEQRKEWPEPNIPHDFMTALQSSPSDIQAMWHDITPMARWEWVRWVNETNNPDTRKRRIEVSIAKMESGKRRPCCFNLAACTDPDVSRSGRLAIQQ